MDTRFQFDSASLVSGNSTETVLAPHFPTSQSVPPAALAWAQRTIERIKSAYVSGRLRVPRPIDLMRNDDEARAAYDEMLTEPMAMTPLRVLVDSVAALDLQVIPEDPDDERQQREAEFVRWCYRVVEGGKLAICRAVAFNGLRRGWSVTEKVWTDQPDGKWAGRWRWRVWKDRDDKTIKPRVDEHMNLLGIEAPDRSGNRVIFDPSDFVVYTHLKLFQNPRGIAAFRTAYRAYIAKTHASQLWGLNLEKWGSPFLVGTYTDEATQRAALELALKSVEANTWVTGPPGTTIEAIMASTGTPANYQAFLDRCDKEMAIGIMGSHLPIMEGANKDPAGSTKEQRGTTELFQWALAEEMSGILTAQAADLLRVNKSDVPPPLVTLGATSEQEVAAILDNATKLHNMGADLSKRQLYSRTGWEPPRDDTDRLPGLAPVSQFGLSSGIGSGLDSSPSPLAQTDGSLAQDASSGSGSGAESLRATVGGSAAIADLQKAFYAGEIPREAAIANAQLIFGFNSDEAATLFPDVSPTKLTPDAPAEPAPAAAGFAEGDPPPGPSPKTSAAAGADGRQADRLLSKAQREGTDRLGKASAAPSNGSS